MRIKPRRFERKLGSHGAASPSETKPRETQNSTPIDTRTPGRAIWDYDVEIDAHRPSSCSQDSQIELSNAKKS
ncbi:hypothetical protein RRU01S_29_00690 [Agrobacterium rubi TR3 = NBRC 13261]|uniref:Uncharacterized protein n=1 Tax=Agrobacterium rubi TR3 = NBRC 13261 TaxID=1368415 RepID=A0A081D206_9HYPH|nr:hypothetical protein RRU01S_29_00690 [Agrobacterium rubi TR3 = NBRC 13261]